jgi:hypothetical protein
VYRDSNEQEVRHVMFGMQMPWFQAIQSLRHYQMDSNLEFGIATLKPE